MHRPDAPAARAASMALALAAAVHGAAQDPAPAPRRAEGTYRWFDPIIDLRAAIVGGFVDEVDAVAMQRAAMEAMARSLGDPYTAWIPPSDERLLRTQLSGSYVGIGVELDLDGGRPVVVTALDGSPALEAGMLPGDVILSVDGRSTEGIGVAGLESLLPGEPGTSARITLRRPDGSERTVDVPRRTVETVSVKGIERDAEGWRHVLDPDRRIGYVRIAQFTDRTAAELDAALARLRADGLSGLVLDLRGNGGGSLEAAVAVADRFLGSGAIVSLRGRGESGRTWDASASADDCLVPVVVLVNQGSASASEVVAGALRDQGRAKVIGTRSYGKGSVQELRPLPDGAGTLRLTTARYYLPGGTSVARRTGDPKWGVEPDTGFRVPMTEAETLAANEARQRREAPTPPGAAASGADAPATWSAPARVRTQAHDPQLAAGLEAMQGFLDAVEWPVVGDLSGDVGAGNDELRASLEYRRRLLTELAKTDASITALRGAGAGVDDPVLAGDADLIDGEVVVRDRDGRVVGRWILKDPAALRGSIGAAATPAPEFTPAREPEGK